MDRNPQQSLLACLCGWPAALWLARKFIRLCRYSVRWLSARRLAVYHATLLQTETALYAIFVGRGKERREICGQNW